MTPKSMVASDPAACWISPTGCSVVPQIHPTQKLKVHIATLYRAKKETEASDCSFNRLCPMFCTLDISFCTSCRSLFCQFPRLWTGFPNGSAGKESAYNAGDSGDSGSILGSESSPGGENGNPLQYSCLKKKTP